MATNLEKAELSALIVDLGFHDDHSYADRAEDDTDCEPQRWQEMLHSSLFSAVAINRQKKAAPIVTLMPAAMGM